MDFSTAVTTHVTSLIQSFATFQASGFPLTSNDVRAHIEADDLFEWLHLCYPDWFHPKSERDLDVGMRVDELLAAARADDTGGGFDGSNGALLLIDYLAHGLRRFAQGTR